ncbi:MAG: sigma-70 family RNA polymerase sigma factor [Deltaproteobacteria bacterium]|nr:sigma-70 family RNA polymerase sigma factor [Deltaproteobacteria bacterium]
MEEEDDHRLLESARSGDEQALQDLLQRHQAQIYRFGLRLCHDPEDARDVLQETLLAMARGVRDFRGASSLSTWLYTIARSHCIKKRRRSTFAPVEERSLDTDATLEVSRVADLARGPDEALAGREVEAALERALAALAPGYREVLLLRDVEGLTAPEVAEVLGLGVDAVKSRLHRARVAVRAQLAPVLGTPEGEAAPGACPDVLAIFSRHLEDDLSADACEEMQRHLQGCARCRGTCESLRRSLALCRSAAAGINVPAPVQASVRVALREFLAEHKT